MASKEPRISGPTLKVLGIFLTSGNREVSGADVSRLTALASGTLYPILSRLELAGWLESRWETELASDLKRPRKRLYRITALGVQKTRAAVQDLGMNFGGREWAWS